MLSILDFSDREICHLVEDLAAEDGYTSSLALAEQMFPGGGTKARSAVGTRLAWMRRYGLVAKQVNEDGKELRGQWALTARGAALMEGAIEGSHEDALNSMGDGGLVTVVELVSDRATADPFVHHVLRRGWINKTRKQW